MGTASILIPGAIQADSADSLVKLAKYAAGAVERGNVVSLGALSSVAGEHEVYLAATPATASLATAIYYMVNEPVNVLVDGKYSGLTDDESTFTIAANKVFTVFKPKVGDEIIISEDGIGGTKSSNTYIIPANNALELTWGSSTSGVSLAWELIETTYVRIPAAEYYNGRKTAYKFRCVVAQ
jgi:hypothetical protein